MKVYIINLKKDVKRKDDLIKQILKLPYTFDYEFITGHNGNEKEDANDIELSKHFVKKWCGRSKHLPYINGQKGCCISHVRLIKSLIDKGENQAYILEDDVILPLSNPFTQPNGGLFFYLGILDNKVIPNYKLKKPNDPKILTTHAYGINDLQTFYNKMITYSPRNIDGIYVQLQRTENIYFKNVCFQNINYSSNMDYKKDSKIPIFRKISALYLKQMK